MSRKRITAIRSLPLPAAAVAESGTRAHASKLARRQAAGASRPVLDAIRARAAVATAKRRVEEARQRGLIARQAEVLHACIDFLDRSSLGAGLMAVTGGLRGRLRCERVVIGLWQGDAIEVSAISQQASIDHDSPDVHLLAEAMREACVLDRQTRLLADKPAIADTELPAHRALVTGRATISVIATPLCSGGKRVGALLVESTTAVVWPAAQLQLLEQLAIMLAPMIVDRRRAGRGMVAHVRERLAEIRSQLVSPRRLGLKSGLAGLSIAIALLILVPVTDRVAAMAELVPVDVRIVSAPIDGYISHVAVAAGDVVTEGQLMVELDARELRLEHDRWEGELGRIAAELRAARASGDRRQSAVLQAQRAQARARLGLAEQRMQRSRVVAPRAGVVISGDLSRLIGAPVERGQRLVELAPGSNYTVSLLVDERDIERIATGQHGALTLQSRPDMALDLMVETIHPIAVASNGVNRFRVDATFEQGVGDLLPGQTGVAKLNVGTVSALRRLTRRFVDWARLLRWEWFG